MNPSFSLVPPQRRVRLAWMAGVALTLAGVNCAGDPEGGTPPGTGGARASGGSAGQGSPSGGQTVTGGAPAAGAPGKTGGINGGTGGATGGKPGGTTGSTGGATGGAGGNGPGSGGTAGHAATGGRGGAGASGLGGGAATGGQGGRGGAGATILGATPPMGWNSWNKYGCDGLNETVVKKMADAFVSSGMRDAGYEYVNLDDCWMDGRDASGKLQWNKTKFPSGGAAIGEYIHARGLKFGIYSTPNTQTCAGIYGGYKGGVGSLGHETEDAQSFASWGVDYLKYDKCRGDLSKFATMRDALRATGRPVFYSINPGDQGPYCTPTKCSIDLPKIANMWRIEFDISARWSEVIRLIDANKKEYIGAGPGHWNDPDMLEVGNGLNDTDGRAHFSMWAIMAAPLITGNDLSTMSETTKAILTNREIIAVDQDPLGQQGRVVATPGTNLEVWSKALTGTNTRAVALFNRGAASASISVKWSDLGLPSGSAKVRDLWAAKDLGSFTDSYTATGVASHAVVMLRVVSDP